LLLLRNSLKSNSLLLQWPPERAGLEVVSQAVGGSAWRVQLRGIGAGRLMLLAIEPIPAHATGRDP
jgi:hypothetical protein